MSNHFQSWPIPLMALSLALLFSLFLLAACGTGANSSTHATSIAVNPATSITAVGDKATLNTGTYDTVAPNATIGFDCANVNQIPSVECKALAALYNSTNGPGWEDNTGWLVTVTPCTWSGIECTGGHVSYISLGYNQLTGILPPELGNFSHLRALGLTANRLQGPIPAEVGNLSELVSLEMSGNQLAGPLPAELGDLPKLRTLSLDNNKLSGFIPSALGNIESLESLVISNNQFSGAIPPELGNLAQLYALYLSHNELSGAIPEALGRLSQLSELDLSYNQLRGPVPEPLAQISGRSLWGNELEGTILGGGQAPMIVSYKGVYFSVDPSLATSIWPEVIAARLSVQDGPFGYAAPEHIRFTFANLHLPSERLRMGINLAAEAQIFVYPLAEMARLNPHAQAQIERLQSLLAARGSVSEGDLPLLPYAHAAQVFHAQAQILDSGNIQGLRFISQHSQDPQPIILNQELFYTFQGFTDDGTYYVAAFFPVTTADLPDTITEEYWAVINDTEASYATYLAETALVLEQIAPADFTPDLTLLDAVVTSLQVEPDSALFGESTSHSNPF
jgi:heat shock protein HspQ